MENCNIIEDGNESLALEKVVVQRIWKKYFEDLYNIHTQEHVALLGFGD